MAAVAVMAATGLGMAAAPAAMAVPVATTSPAGTYTLNLIIPKAGSVSFPMTLSAKGHFAITGGPKGTWTESGTTVTMTGKLKKDTYVFVATQRGANLGSKAHPGTLTDNGIAAAKWYATAG